jgi:hypothetical protein
MGMAEEGDPHSDGTRTSAQETRTPLRIRAAGEMVSERYRLLDQVGAGSTGVVFKATDLAFDREVAVKVMSHSHGDATATFLREARTTARLDHPNIVPIHDLVWLNDGGIAFAMKLIDGMSLRQALREKIDGQPPRCLATVNDTITVFLKVCDGIALAHARGVIHRDIKPDNILIGAFGEVIILDWGEASVGDGQGQGQPVGTPLYMSPEQARGEPATPASDVYCIAASLFHCLLLRPPLDGAHVEPEAFWEGKRRGERRPLTDEESARCDRRLLAVLDKALAAAPEARYATVRALADDLAAYQGGQAVSAYRDSWAERAMRWYRRNARTVWLSGLLIMLTAALVGVLWGSHLQRLASWGRPVFQERFADGWQERWTPTGFATEPTAGGTISSLIHGEGSLILRREWPPRSAIEFTGEIAAGAPEGDISVFWLEGAAAEEGRWRDCRSGWAFQFGAWDNTCSVLEAVGRGVIACNPLVVSPGRKHRIRAEVDGDRRRLLIDERTVFDHHDSFSAGSGRWMIYTWGPGKVVSDVAVYLRGSAELVSAMDVPDALRRQGLAREAAAEYRVIADSQAGSDLADRASFKEGITWSELGDWERAGAAWQGIGDARLAEEAAILALQPLMKPEPERLLGEIARRWPGASATGRQALIRLWIASSQLFESTRGAFAEGLVERYFDLRRQLFPEAAHADPATMQVGRRTGRLRLAFDLTLNRTLRAQLLERIGDVERLRAEGTPNVRMQLEQRLSRVVPVRARQPVAAPLPAWMAPGTAAERQALLPAGDQQAATDVARLFGDPRTLMDHVAVETTLINSLWLHALATGDLGSAARWERQNVLREADRSGDGTWVQSLLEPIGILAGLGRRDEARQLVERLRREPRANWKGEATLWGEALAGTTAEPLLPRIVHANALLAAMRADLAGEPAAAMLWRSWFDEALPSYSVTSLSLLRLADWRSGNR